MAKSSGIVDYIRERFADLEDPAAVKKPFFPSWLSSWTKAK